MPKENYIIILLAPSRHRGAVSSSSSSQALSIASLPPSKTQNSSLKYLDPESHIKQTSVVLHETLVTNLLGTNGYLTDDYTLL